MSLSYRQRLMKLILAGGGTVEGERFVTRPGVLMMNVTAPTPEAMALLDDIGLDTDLEPSARVAAFDARLTYLAFPESARRTGEQYLGAVVQGKSHTSVTARAYASVLFAGQSLEDSVELLAGRAGKSARLTSSDTEAMSDTLYRTQGSPDAQQQQREDIERFLLWRASLSRDAVGGRYPHNMLNLSCRATTMHMGMCIQDWHALFGGRLVKDGNEENVRELFARACLLLHTRFPYLIQLPPFYGYQEILP